MKKAKEVSSTDIRRNFTQYVSRAGYGGESFLIKMRQENLAALIPMHVYERLVQLASKDAA